jgi:hypothetical protein
MSLSADTLAALDAMPAQFARLYRSVPADRWDWRPASWEACPGETFTAREHVCHLRDIEIDGYQIRIRRTRDEQRPILEPLDGYLLAKERRYGDTDPMQGMAAFAGARAMTLDMIRSLDEAQLKHRASFAEYGDVSLQGLIYILCSHDQQHLACMHWLLGKMS